MAVAKGAPFCHREARRTFRANDGVGGRGDALR